MASRKSTESGHGKKAGFRALATRLAWSLAISLALHAGVGAALFSGWKALRGFPETDQAHRSPVPFHILNRPTAGTPPAAEPAPLSKAPAEPRRKPRVGRDRPPPSPARRTPSETQLEGPSPLSEVGTRGGTPTVTANAQGATTVAAQAGRTGQQDRATPDPLVEARRSYALMVREAIRDSGRYPPVARRRRLEGQAVLGIRVESGGRIARVRLLEGSGHGLLDQTALAWGRALRTLPPPPGGIMDVIVPVDFSLK